MADFRQYEQLADRVLAHLRAQPHHSDTPAALATRFEISNEQLSAALGTLREWGYKLDVAPNAVRLLSAPDILSATEIGFELGTTVMGRSIYAYRSIGSTNDRAAELARADEPEGTIVVAEEQTEGRGRFQRQWHSPPQGGIYLSVLLRPPFAPDRAPGISIMTGLALAETLDPYCPGQVRIKWPNDNLIDSRKAVGILTELSAEPGRVEYVIVGVGINVNMQSEDFLDELKPIATSVRVVSGQSHSRVKLLQQFLRQMEREYELYCRGGLASSRERLRRFSSLIGKRVTLTVGKRFKEGEVLDIDTNGALVLRTAKGDETITSGEVTIVKP